jgi:hypothetical protein
MVPLILSIVGAALFIFIGMLLNTEGFIWSPIFFYSAGISLFLLINRWFRFAVIGIIASIMFYFISLHFEPAWRDIVFSGSLFK